MRFAPLALCAALVAAAPAEAAGPNVGTVWPPAAIIYVPCGANLSNYIGGSSPAGTFYQLAGSADRPCTYGGGQQFHTASSITVSGDCSSSTGANTIIDGGNGSNLTVTNGNADGTTAVVIMCLTVQNYGGSANCITGAKNGCGTGGAPSTENWSAAIEGWNGWVFRAATFRGAGGYGVLLAGSASLVSSLVTENYHAGVGCQTALTGADGGPITIVGNEVSFNNVRNDSRTADAAGVRCIKNGAGPAQGVAVLDDYVHDNYAIGVWCAAQCSPMFTAQGNTILHNSGEGIRHEVSYGGDISGNVLQANDYPDYAAGAGQIALLNSGGVAAHDNNLTVAASWGAAIVAVDTNRGSLAGNAYGNTVSGNTVTFLGAGGASGWNDQCNFGGGCGTGYAASYGANSWKSNSYYSPGGAADQHFEWSAGGANSTLCTLAQAQAGSGCSGVGAATEAGSTIAVGNAGVAGCRHIGCTGSGWPLPAGFLTDDAGSYVLTNDSGLRELTPP
jgi:hypothetical protein